MYGAANRFLKFARFNAVVAEEFEKDLQEIVERLFNDVLVAKRRARVGPRGQADGNIVSDPCECEENVLRDVLIQGIRVLQCADRRLHCH